MAVTRLGGGGVSYHHGEKEEHALCAHTRAHTRAHMLTDTRTSQDVEKGTEQERVAGVTHGLAEVAGRPQPSPRPPPSSPLHQVTCWLGAF